MSTTAQARLLAPLSTRAEHPALRFEGRVWSFGELAVRADAWTRALRDAGVRRGDRVAALGGASPTIIAAMLGAYRLGAVWVPINPRYASPEISHVVSDCAASLVLVDPALAAKLRDGKGGAITTPAVATLPLQPRPAPSSPSPTPPLAEDDDTALLIYTSGTTGPSKGVALSYRAVVDGISALTALWQWTPDDTLSLQLPLFHVHGLCIGVHGALLHGLTTTLASKFEPARVVADVDEGATIFMGVPTMYARLLAHLDTCPQDGAVLQRARLFTAGSAALAASDLHAFERHTGHRIIERYGMSESLITLSNPYDGERRAGSVGRPLPGVTIRVVDETGAPVPDGDSGELHVQTPGMMTGYFGQANATEAAFDGPWLRTGDLVVRSADGYVRVLGRLSVDIIKTGGFKVATREIEDALITHPAVREIAVFGVPDPVWGERIVAAVALHPSLGSASTLEGDALVAALVEHCKDVIADYKRPRGALVVDALPRNAMGKVLKVALRERVEAGYAPADSR